MDNKRMLKIISKALFGALFLCGAAQAQAPSSIPLSPLQIQAATNTAIAPNLPGGITALSLNAIINQFDPFTNLWFDANTVQNGLLNKWNGSTWAPLVIQPANGGTGAVTAAANTVFSGPASGAASAPAFRTLVALDFPISISETFTGGLISVAGSPSGASGTFALTVAGTSGGIPYFASGTTWASSGVLTANAIVLGGGAGASPTSVASLGTATTLLHGNASGPPAFSAVSVADITAALTTPPPIGATTPNTIGGSTLTIGAPGLVGDGVTINNTALQAALTAVAGGGFIHLPCGIFKITAGMSVTVASGAHITFEGSGICTKILASSIGSATALSFNYADQTASVDVKNFWMVTDTTGTATAIGEMLVSNNSLEAYAPPNVIENVVLTGSDYPAATTKYWGLGLNLSNTSNTSIVGYILVGGGCVASVCGGNGIQLTGNGVTYGVVYNIVNSNFGLCASAIIYGNFVQGVQIVNSNFTGVNVAAFLVTNPTGVADELEITGSQLNCVSVCLDLIGGTGTLANFMVSNSLFIPFASSTMILISKNINYSITNNTFNGAAGAIDISIAGASTNGIIADNTMAGGATGINIGASTVNTGTVIRGNQMGTFTTANYSVGAASSGYIIDDPNKNTIAGLFSCIAGIGGSRSYVHDTAGAAVPTYHLTVAGSGATTVDSPVYCNQTTVTWQYN